MFCITIYLPVFAHQTTCPAILWSFPFMVHSPLSFKVVHQILVHHSGITHPLLFRCFTIKCLICRVPPSESIILTYHSNHYVFTTKSHEFISHSSSPVAQQNIHRDHDSEQSSDHDEMPAHQPSPTAYQIWNAYHVCMHYSYMTLVSA